jgi:hypothetical protein
LDANTGAKKVLIPERISLKNLINFWEAEYNWLQPSIFFPGKILSRLGGLDENLKFAMDKDIYCRLIQVCPIQYIEQPVSVFRVHDDSKTGSSYNDMMLEHAGVALKYVAALPGAWRRAFKREASLFLIRRAKYLVMNRSRSEAARCLRFALRLGFVGFSQGIVFLVQRKIRNAF